ncbi:sensor histidine kinase [Skermania sp. ID1734]|uniref:sensor histidine kinase n=1 Tax=Skermania sp. ID1734 TaxID=2597516 RepID=UPI00163DA037|nr:ATP-binding protein [Skermania sp. ID1734]
MAAIFAPPAVFGIAAFRRRFDVMRAAAAASVIGYILAALSWRLAWDGELIPTNSFWVADIPGLAGLVAATVWPPRRTIIAFFVATLSSLVPNHSGRTPDHSTPVLPDVLFSVSFSLLFVAAALMVVRAGRLLDETRVTALSAAASAASSQARTVQRQRFNALLHDWVMSTLLAASKQGNSDAVRRQADITLTKFDDDGRDDEGYSVAGLLAHLRIALNAIDDTTPLTWTVADDGDLVFPGEVVRTVTAASVEALRNSIRHAGPTATRDVSIRITTAGFNLTVADTGVGFDVHKVPPDRLGVAASIVGRMQRLTGGAVDVDSRPAAGTAVRLSWTRS